MSSGQSFEGTMSIRWIKPLITAKGKRIQDPTSGIIVTKFRNPSNDNIEEEIIPVIVVYKREHTKVFKPKGLCSSNKKLGCCVVDYPLNKYLIKNFDKIIFFTPVKENLYAIFVEKSLLE